MSPTDRPRGGPTPGPWTRVVSRDQSARYTRVRSRDYGAIAECAGMRPDPEENAANAAFITAAPETAAEGDRLREALERIAHLDETEGAGDVGAAMTIARAALGLP